ncbi:MULTISPECIES: H-NS histone family protein [Burkholderiaceae]|jgi:DNA-binding protein H-NS|uniref:Histidinol phosphate phosphatase n=1 Tax=Paraburkholderia aromaticivorans TaxID=2026199 RepID=A0A248VZG4_9BURK|nr:MULTISPECIES: H-NS histone family protein [Burkholderiaceae]EIF28109.1 DNA-binding protein H-NS [Burkholderia sp. Ch1-1]HDR9771415.1 H-NS histone family protein [Burkholderia cepacia ATCC 25416]ASW04255.1 histidinol phosphate phosphatase [Paraburkholderia aromaticivorans]MCA8081632.1 H-NS histone family protein [Burkholderia cepacia]HDR9779073.1 H-NS histone family protein [Burkholderia cepacia ATCC 25416]
MTNPPARLTIYQQLLSELAELDKRIEQARARERVHAIETIHGLMDTYGIKHKDLVGRNGRRGAYQVNALPARYRDPATGQEWCGRGNVPRWIREQDRTRFLID